MTNAIICKVFHITSIPSVDDAGSYATSMLTLFPFYNDIDFLPKPSNNN